MHSAPAPPFTSAAARLVLDAACARVGLPSEGAELLRFGENAIFRLAHERVVVRIARNTEVLDDVRKEVRVAQWLQAAHLPAANTTGHTQPLVVQGRPVTFWDFIDSDGTQVGLGELGRVLRRLHELPVPEQTLPPWDMFGRVAERIALAEHLDQRDREFLSGRLADLRRQYAQLEFPLSPAAVHGDAHNDNLIRRPDGTVTLIDFERFAFGAPEADLSVTATEYLLGWHTDEEYEAFTTAYGFDIATWGGFGVLQAVNHLKMTTWLMQNVTESTEVAEEVSTRLASLRDGEPALAWRPF